MIDIVCPSCHARYRLPDGAIGENGRRVSCSSCGHSWHAHPEPEEEAPLTLGPEAVAEPSPAPARPQSGHASEMTSTGPKPAPQPAPGNVSKSENPYASYDADPTLSGTSPYADEEDRGMAAYEAFAREQEEIEEAEDEGTTPPERTPAADLPEGPSRKSQVDDDRSAQMAQIRSMLDDIKKSPGATMSPEDDREEEEEAPPPPRPSAIERSLREVEEEERDPLREKLDQYKRPGGKVGDVKVTRKKMLQKHAKKVRRRRIEEKRGSGTFLTGFLLIVLVVSIMATVYLLHPLIIAKVPEAEPAIRDYVATMDQFRVWLGEQVAALQATIEGIISDE